MPWTVKDVDRFNKGLGRKEKRTWVTVANNALKACLKKGGKNESECAASAIRIANGVIKKRKEKTMDKVSEALTKNVNGKELPASSFLVVEDPKKATTWHLPVKNADGTPNRSLAGAAWAALFSAGGHRGQKYSGPNSAQAKSKLKALYKAQDWPEPNSEAEIQDAAAAEGDYYVDWVPMGVYSFEQLDAMEHAQETSEAIQELTTQFTSLVRNIVWYLEGDKLAAVKSVSDEFVARLEDVLVNPEISNDGEDEEASESATTAEDEPLPIFREANTIQVLGVENAVGADMRTVPLEMSVRIIQPGWGNKVDNHYYPAEVLKRDAVKFTGVKMFETDHNQDEKSTRTWVSTISEVSSFDDAGAPIGKVVVHVPDFAERVRALNAAGLLDKLECSIYASGRAQPGYKEGDRLGKRITEITEAFSVDWVTRAGAGGKALGLQENALGGDGNMDKDKKKEETEVPAAEAETSTPATKEQPVAITEASQEQDDKPKTEGNQEQPTAEADNKPVVLTAEAVMALLVESKLPAAAVSKLATAEYADESAVRHAITTERDYLDAVIGAGNPVDMGETYTSTAAQGDPAKVVETKDRVNKKYFGR